jgi:hypothetical protein
MARREHKTTGLRYEQKGHNNYEGENRNKHQYFTQSALVRKLPRDAVAGCESRIKYALHPFHHSDSFVNRSSANVAV